MPTADLTPLWHTAAELERQIETHVSGLDLLEGKRFLLRMLAASVETYVEHGDAERPAFHHAVSPTRKMFADCPDTDYLRAPIAVGPGRCYRVWGRIPEGTLYVGVLLYGKGGRVGNRLADTDLQLDSHGRFELFVSTDPQSGTWLAADGDETAVLVRQYFTDRNAQPPMELHVELVGAAEASSRPAVERLPEQLTRAERMLRSVFKRTLHAHQMIQAGPANRFLDIPGERLFPTPDNKYRAARFQLDDSSQHVPCGAISAGRQRSTLDPGPASGGPLLRAHPLQCVAREPGLPSPSHFPEPRPAPVRARRLLPGLRRQHKPRRQELAVNGWASSRLHHRPRSTARR
jgi:hypothetical protein